MNIDGPVYLNPVVLAEPVIASEYTSLLSTLPEYRYKDRIVGFTNFAVYACAKRVAKSGYYEMHCDPFPWAEVQRTEFRRFFSPISVLLGFGFVILGIALFYMGWIAKTHTGTAILWMPFAAPIAGYAFIRGARRLRLTAYLGKRKLEWVAPPLFKHESELLDRLKQIPDLTIDTIDG